MQQPLDRSMNDNDPETTAKPDPVKRKGYNQHGQKIGSKGERTRNALITSTVELLETHGLRDVSVADVARHARTSPATFYVYFRDVADVVLAALENTAQTSPEVEEIASRDWLARGNEACSRRFVDSYCELWNRHRTIFCVRNMAAEEGDERFYAARMTAAMPMMEVLTAKIAQAQAAGLVPPELKPRSCAGTVLMMLERLAAIGPVTRADDDISYESLRAAAAHSVALMVGAFR